MTILKGLIKKMAVTQCKPRILEVLLSMRKKEQTTAAYLLRIDASTFTHNRPITRIYCIFFMNLCKKL